MKKVEESWRQVKKLRKIGKVEKFDWIAIWYKCIKLELRTLNATGEKSIEKFEAAGFSESRCWSLKKTLSTLAVCHSAKLCRWSFDKLKNSASNSNTLILILLYHCVHLPILHFPGTWDFCPRILVGAVGAENEWWNLWGVPSVCKCAPLPLSPVLHKLPNYSFLTPNLPIYHLGSSIKHSFLLTSTILAVLVTLAESTTVLSRGETLTNPTDRVCRMNSETLVSTIPRYALAWPQPIW